MSPKRTARVISTTALLTLGAFIVAAASAQEPERADRRVQNDGENLSQPNWTLIGGVPPRLDSDLLHPLLLDASQTQVALVDYGDKSVKMFSVSGDSLIWQAGRQGRGPGEWLNPTDIHIDDEERAWITDPVNHRITVLGSDGTTIRTIRPQKPLIRAVPVSDDRILGIPMGGAGKSVMAYWLDSEGRIVQTVPTPPDLRDVHFLAWEPLLTRSGAGDRVVVGFLYSDLLLFLAPDEALPSRAQRDEPIAFPKAIAWNHRGKRAVRLDPSAWRVTLSLTSRGDTVFALRGRKDKSGGRTVDTYSVRSGAYLGSFRLPVVVDALAAVPGGFATLTNDPVPTLGIWSRERE